MKNARWVLLSLLFTAGLGLGLLISAAGPQQATAAPVMAPTPVAVTRPALTGYDIRAPLSARAITTHTTSSCYDVARAATVDAVYVIDQATTNTVTLYSMWSIDGTTLVTGTALASSIAADTTDMTQVQVFGRWFCVRAMVTNTNTLTVTVQTIAK